jgi:hypothetical protein
VILLCLFSISRFHFLIRRERVAAVAGSPYQFRYFIQDLGSLNGLYIDEVKARHAQWQPLHEGALIRFFPQTRTGRSYLIALGQAAVDNEERRRKGEALVPPVLPPLPLTLKDCHMELMFSHEMSASCVRRFGEIDAPLRESNRHLSDDDDDAPIDVFGNVAGQLAARNNAPAAAPAAAAAAAAAAAPSPSDMGDVGEAAAAAVEIRAPAAASAAAFKVGGTSLSRFLPADYHHNAALLAAERAHKASKAAFYDRLRTKTLADLAARDAAAQSMEIDNVGAGPAPSTFSQIEAANAAAANNHAASRKHAREDGDFAAAAAAGAGASSVAPPTKRARASGMQPWILFQKENRAIVRAQLQAGIDAGHAKMTPTELNHSVTRELSSRWRQLGDAERVAVAARASIMNPTESINDVLIENELRRRHLQPLFSLSDAAAAAAAPSPIQVAQPAAAAASFVAASAAAGSAPKAAAVKRIREIADISSDDEDMPVRRPDNWSSSAAAAAAASSVSSIGMSRLAPFHNSDENKPAAVAAAAVAPLAAAAEKAEPLVAPIPPHPHVVKLPNNALEVLLEDYTCGICADIIYQCVVLDCGHSYCKSCILEWFKKKKCCPVCRSKHKGVPSSVRVADATINMLVDQLLKPDAKAERKERTQRIDEEQRIDDAKKAIRDQAKLDELLRQVGQPPQQQLQQQLAAARPVNEVWFHAERQHLDHEERIADLLRRDNPLLPPE